MHLKPVLVFLAALGALANSFVIDSVDLPTDVPPEIGAVDFASDGMLYVALRRGDIVVANCWELGDQQLDAAQPVASPEFFASRIHFSSVEEDLDVGVGAHAMMPI